MMDELAKKRFRSALEDVIYSLELSAKCYHYQDEPEYKELLDHMNKTKASLTEELHRRKKVAESLFGILPPDAKEKRYYTQEEFDKEFGFTEKDREDLSDVDFED